MSISSADGRIDVTLRPYWAHYNNRCGCRRATKNSLKTHKMRRTLLFSEVVFNARTTNVYVWCPIDEGCGVDTLITMRERKPTKNFIRAEPCRRNASAIWHINHEIELINFS